MVATHLAVLLAALLAALVGGPALARAPTPPPAVPPALSPAAATGPPVLAVTGSGLSLDGSGATLHGVNAYSATTYWPVNWGCGTMVADLDAAFASFGRGALVRTWAFQALGFDNKRADRLDFTGIDRVVRAAERQGVLLELVLSDQAGTCDDGHWHDRDWYAGGYRPVHPDDGRGLTPVSYATWVQLVVRRYASSPAVAVWGPVNEPETADCAPGRQGRSCYGHSTCPPDAAAVLRRFFDTVGGLIHRLDPGSLVASGVIGGEQCGLAGDGYRHVHASPGIDLATFHDYGAEGAPLPDQLAQRLEESDRLGKPLLVEEVGVGASADAGDACRTRLERRDLHVAKARAAAAAGADGYLPWWWDPGSPGGCSQALRTHDPTLVALRPGPPAGRDSSTPGGGLPVPPVTRWRPAPGWLL